MKSRLRALLCAASLALLSPLASAQSFTSQDPELQAVHDAFVKRFDAEDVVMVRRTPFKDLYEIQINTGLLYADARVNYVMDGTLIDAAKRVDLTQARMEQLAMETAGSLPFEAAIKQVKGDGKRWVAIFEDPNCRYCKQLRRTLEDLDDVTIYTFLYPILSEDSHEKSRNLWCAPDRQQALDDWMLRGKAPARAECDTPIRQVLTLGRQLMVQGTPAIFFDDGTRVSGALPLDRIQARLGRP